ncbi:tannase/feruloyl esterase family alpha/beta hydrolase [Phenylobacterium soli]|uniref:Tannase/feruloyl esterase family alpha/beta hydrolase n=1 Tax=Phenylobacterium soli TaxID=2170551 RepID=A0A328AET9_9CAUL|nr:tannase/feruloyl esterase family alpha/beta hydrolase [Phenylobacterium soli]RAK53242.1 tannase/feruloyl esterase family alpha/beta hydrolase [Phenylobacterium soli]
MKRMLMAAGAAMALTAPGLAHAETACADMAKAALPHAEVLSAKVEKAGQLEACRIAVASHPTKDSDIRIEVWIPLGEAWNGKFLQVGNGGFAGKVPVALIRSMAARGYAAAGTDDGHDSPVGTNAAWALGHPEKVADFGWRALKETTDIGKAMVVGQKGLKPKRSYFAGCSDGGREALMEAQRYPADFDGVVAGAPANYMSQLFGISAAQQQALSAPGGYLGAAQLQLIQKAALAQCGGGEAFIRDPGACHFDPGKLQCKAGEADGCLTTPQVRAARAIYDGRRDPRTGKIAFPGFSPGAEAQPGSWQAWITGADEARHSQAAGYQFSSNAFKYFAFGDPAFDFLKLDLGAQFDRAHRKMAPVIDSDSPNLAAFKAHGGKLIQYHGWNDPAIPARSSIRYYEDVRRTMGEPSGFYRMYLIPGMLHCAGGPGPGEVDWVGLLDAWVVEGKAPEAVEASAGNNAAAAAKTQLLCPHPGVARKTGDAWSCAARRPSKTKG